MMTSSFGALHASILATARVPYAMARDGLFFEGLAKVSRVWARISLRVSSLWSGRGRRVESEITEMPAGVSPGEIFRGHIPELDGLRAAGMAIVLLNHFWSKDMSVLIWHLKLKAWIAMDSFFVLSGFFISASVIKDCRAKRWSWSGYAASRCTRLYVVLLPGLLLTLSS